VADLYRPEIAGGFDRTAIGRTAAEQRDADGHRGDFAVRPAGGAEQSRINAALDRHRADSSGNRRIQIRRAGREAHFAEGLQAQFGQPGCFARHISRHDLPEIAMDGHRAEV